MKKYIILIFICISAVFSTSCKEYLDKAPEQGLLEDEIFANADNFRLFFNAVYEGQSTYNGSARDFNVKPAFPLYFNFWDQKYTWEGITDAADQGRYMEGHNLKSGSVIGFVDKFINDGNRRPILKSMFMNIRICNLALDKIDMVQDISDEERNDIIGQAHFIRAFSHFELFRIWGPMPYITKVIGEEDQWDIPRLSKHETLIRISQDFDTSYTFFELAGKLRRDPAPGQAGHLTDPDQRCPTGVAAKAYKARALLYAASPLNNEMGDTDWQNAAIANWEALQIAIANNYALLSGTDRKSNFFGAKYTNEELWAWDAGEVNWNDGRFAGLYNGVFGASKSSWSGVCPTQNFIDKYETSFAEPLNTEADRAAAAAAGHYNEQDPFKNRDPRLATDIITNQSPCTGWTGGKAQIWFDRSTGETVYSELLDQSYLGITRTGYYLRKNWGNNSQKKKDKVRQSDPLLRLAELYLNYAEAANEAYGPAGNAPGATLTAIAAINVIRQRMGQRVVLPAFTGTKEIFRDRIKNERNVELSWEGHYYHDIRRWMDAPAAYSSSLYGMVAEKVPVSTEFPTGFKYVRTRLGNDRQPSWKPAMYYLPFNTTDNFKMRNFVPNVVW